MADAILRAGVTLRPTTTQLENSPGIDGEETCSTKGPLKTTDRKPVLVRTLLSKKRKHLCFYCVHQNLQYEPSKKELVFVFYCEYNTLKKI